MRVQLQERLHENGREILCFLFSRSHPPGQRLGEINFDRFPGRRANFTPWERWDWLGVRRLFYASSFEQVTDSFAMPSINLNCDIIEITSTTPGEKTRQRSESPTRLRMCCAALRASDHLETKCDVRAASSDIDQGPGC